MKKNKQTKINILQTSNLFGSKVILNMWIKPSFMWYNYINISLLLKPVEQYLDHLAALLSEKIKAFEILSLLLECLENKDPLDPLRPPTE